ncbi:MAG: M14 family murein peptide amidase A [Candidatus Gastranaerophilales bacterium]|nr:M14 family murein peptide amidase A [Candidatus Gastranaerophilales bacterium]
MIVEKTTSTLGREIFLLEKSPEKYDKTILIIGVFHGDEPEGEQLISKFLNEKVDYLSLKNRLLILPCLNPDGKEAKTRQNANMVDLNRNFPTKNWEKVEDKNYFGGDEPNSEAETQFMVKIIEKYKPDMILSLHTPYKIVNYDGDAKEIAEKISKLTGYKIEASIGYPTPGSFGTYAGIERKIPTITLELPDNESFEQLWIENEPVFDFLSIEII